MLELACLYEGLLSAVYLSKLASFCQLLAGNTSAIGGLLLGSASLENTNTAAAQNLSNTVQANLPAQSQQEAFSQAVLQGVQHLQTDANPSLNSTALLIDAAVIAQKATAVSEAFSQARRSALALQCIEAFQCALFMINFLITAV